MGCHAHSWIGDDDLEADEALIVTLDPLPDGVYWGFQLGDVWSRSLEFTQRQTSLNMKTVVAAARYVRAHDLPGVIVCTDSYHTPRTRLCFAALGVPSGDGSVPAGPRQMGWGAWWRMRLREIPAIPYDGVLALTKRGALQPVQR